MGSRGFDHCALPGLIYFASAAEHRAHEIVLGRRALDCWCGRCCSYFAREVRRGRS